MTVQLEFRLNGEVPVRLFTIKARKFFGLSVLLFFTIPFGLSVTGCGHKAVAVTYCNGHDTGPVVGELATIQLEPSLAIVGESLNYGQIGPSLSATGYDCKGSVVSLSHITYATSNSLISDINPSTGQACGGTFNRTTSGGVPDFTTCNPPTTTPTQYLSYITATSNGIASNAIPVYTHAVATSIVFGTTKSSCAVDPITGLFTDPDTTCCPPTVAAVSATFYDGTSCVSQSQIRQIAARVYSNGTNITCQAGHISWGTEGSANVASIDQNGVVTARQPGSVAITGYLSNSSSSNSVGFFSTCPPISITLSPVGQPGATNITVPLHNTQPITATAVDKNGTALTGLTFEFNSTTPTTIAGASTLQPSFPGTAVITAVCQPPSCNSAPYSQIGYLGNGKPLTSAGLTVTATGTSSTLLYIASTNSQYVLPIDFSTGISLAPVKLPYVPNSMALTQDGSTLYFGSPQGLMTLTTANNQVGSTNTLLPGTVISVSPISDIVIVTDPLRQTISLVSGGGSTVSSVFNGVATHAAWATDGQSVSITTTGNNILTYSTYTNWQSTLVSQGTSLHPSTVYNDVAELQPSIGAYFAGNNAVDGRSYCPLSQNVGGGSPPTENNTFSPLADTQVAHIDRIATTTDDKHVLGASTATGFTDIFLTSTPADCTTLVAPATERTAIQFGSNTRTVAFAGVTPSLITGVLPSSNAAIAFVTYTGTGSKLPYYLPVATGNTGTLNYFPLTGGAIAPVSGVFSSDDSTFFVGTSGDNKVHLLTITYPTSGAPVITDSSQITPALPDTTGTTTAVPNLIAQHPKATKN